MNNNNLIVGMHPAYQSRFHHFQLITHNCCIKGIHNCICIRELAAWFSGGHSSSIRDHPPTGHRTYCPLSSSLLLPESPSPPTDHCPSQLPFVAMRVSKPRFWCSLSLGGKHSKLYLTANLFADIT